MIQLIKLYKKAVIGLSNYENYIIKDNRSKNIEKYKARIKDVEMKYAKWLYDTLDEIILKEEGDGLENEKVGFDLLRDEQQKPLIELGKRILKATLEEINIIE